MIEQVKNKGLDKYPFFKKKLLWGHRNGQSWLKKQTKKHPHYYGIGIFNIFIFQVYFSVLVLAKKWIPHWIHKKFHFKTPQTKTILKPASFWTQEASVITPPKLSLKLSIIIHLLLTSLLSTECSFIPVLETFIFKRKKGIS